MPDVFISYVGEDSEIAVAIANGIEAQGFGTWYYEKDSIPGVEYLQQVSYALDRCSAVILIISPQSLGSYQVHNEVVHAYEEQKKFLPVLHGVTHEQFQRRQPVWRQALGATTSIAIPGEDVARILPRIVAGLAAIGVVPNPDKTPEPADTPHRPSDASAKQPARPVAERQKPADTPVKDTQRSRTPVVIAAVISALAVIAGALWWTLPDRTVETAPPPVEPAIFGYIYISTQPAGATVYIDGVRRTEQTPAMFDRIPAGTVSVRLTMRDRDDVTRSVDVAENEYTRLENVVLPPRSFSVNIASEPMDAEVLWNGERAGRTPLTIRGVPTGTYELRIVKPQHVEHTERVRVPGEGLTLTRRLEAGAVEFRGHWVRTAYRDSVLQVERAAAERERIAREQALREQEIVVEYDRRAELKPVGYITVIIIPADAQVAVFIDGMRVGTSSAQLTRYEVPVGERVVEVRKPGHATVRRTVTVTPGKTARVDVSFTYHSATE